MNFEINQEEMQVYANQRMKQLIDERIKAQLKGIQWDNEVKYAVRETVERRIKTDEIKKVLSEIDKQSLLEELSDYIAAHIVDLLSRDD